MAKWKNDHAESFLSNISLVKEIPTPHGIIRETTPQIVQPKVTSKPQAVKPATVIDAAQEVLDKQDKESYRFKTRKSRRNIMSIKEQYETADPREAFILTYRPITGNSSKNYWVVKKVNAFCGSFGIEPVAMTVVPMSVYQKLLVEKPNMIGNVVAVFSDETALKEAVDSGMIKSKKQLKANKG